MFVSFLAILTNASRNGPDVVCSAHAEGRWHQAHFIGREHLASDPPLRLFGRRFFRRRRPNSFVRRRERCRRRWQGRVRDVPRSPPPRQGGRAPTDAPGHDCRLSQPSASSTSRRLPPPCREAHRAHYRRTASRKGWKGFAFVPRGRHGRRRVGGCRTDVHFNVVEERTARCGRMRLRAGEPAMRNCSFLFAPCAQTLVAPSRTRRRYGQASSRADKRERPFSSRRLGPPCYLGCLLMRTRTLL